MCLTHVVRVLPTRALLDLCRSRSQDAANVNNWHWAEIDLMPWAKERLEGLLVGLAAQNVPDKGWVKVTKLEKCEGEASVSNRKGKRIVAFELKVVFKWEGSVDYDEVSGELQLPYVSEDVDNGGYELKWTMKDGKDAMRGRTDKMGGSHDGGMQQGAADEDRFKTNEKTSGGEAC